MGRAEEIFERLRKMGVSAIDEFILNRHSEELFLDFKRSADNGSGPKVMHENDRNNLARAISGFGNSEGGVVVWGIDASADVDGADVAKTRVPIENVVRFKSWLEGSVSGRTVPAHSGIQHFAIELGNGNGFVATLVPKSEIAPHQSIFDSRYYMRAGSSFLPVPHSVLAGMFGRRPQATLFHMYASGPARIVTAPGEKQNIEANIGFQIYNKGPVIARDLYSNVQLFLPKENCGASFQPNENDWTGRMNFGVWLSQISKAEFRLGPESLTQLFTMHLSIGPPFSNGKFWVKWTFGCEGSPINLVQIEHDFMEVENLYREFFTGSQGATEGHEFVSKLFNMSRGRQAERNTDVGQS